MDSHDNSKKSFKETLNLPRTDFPIRANAAVEDVTLLERWQQEDLYHASFEHNTGHAKYILHDGPPYANGNIHLGHAYNKILKDILCKSRRMSGYHVPVTPGWDCHGLPIELKVAQENPGLSSLDLKKACRTYANNWIDVQRQAFKNLGVLMDWDHPYITMDYAYEAVTVKAFGKLVKNNFIERKNKTVPWCFNDKTVLASAEIEYKDRKDPSLYVLFEFKQADSQRLFGIDNPVSILVWTTTPWTLPLNRAVLVKPNAQYVLLNVKDTYIVVGADVADKIAQLVEGEKQVLKQFNSKELGGLSVKHPFIDQDSPLLFDDSVGTQEGTAFVHCAPGCGPIDYEVGVKNGLSIYSPISADGKYTQDIEPKELVDMPVAEGQIWVIRKLAQLQKLFYKTNITHSYPHCWRCHNGLIFRATPQWFFDLERQNVKQRALDAIEAMNFIPDRGRNFLRATVENRWEWCLSRQRVWGTPIPALLCVGCDKDYLTPELIDKVAEGIAREGIEYWDRVNLEDLIDPTLACSGCGVTNFKKEYDILDVWFDAGVSHYAVLFNNPALAFPADIYLEGVDQHRGWFQSSLLTSLVLEQEPCTKTIMAHGYTVDAKGQKMSKSLGNVVAPQDIVKQVGTDGLRLWVASIGHGSDPVVSDVLLRNVAEVYRKIRNTCRFMLSNLYDFDITKDAVPADKLLPFDRYAVTQLSMINEEITQAYESVNFTDVFHKLADYCSVELSAFYLDIVKDRLYVEKATGTERRSAQTALWYILDTLTRLIAPVLSFTAEWISDFYQKDKKSSIHLQNFPNTQKLRDYSFGGLEPLWPAQGTQVQQGAISKMQLQLEEQTYLAQWATLKQVRSVLLKALEVEREKELIKHSLEAKLVVYLDLNQENLKYLETLFSLFTRYSYSLEQFFKEFLIVSQFELASSSQGLQSTTMPGVYVLVSHAEGVKCPRCWQWSITSNVDNLCERCACIVC
ncbi:isoleucine--tRNA ligase [Candidatus Dependentiae bacterium]|nr:isoleucine--tRNA ligase [Candidatus Dependentiae bacterium]